MTITAPQVQATPQIIDVPLRFGADDIADLDVADPTINSDTSESIDIGGAGPLVGRYLRIEAADLILVADELHRLADRITTAVYEARDEKLEAERHDCWCGTRLEADEVTCGAERCERAELLDLQGRL